MSNIIYPFQIPIYQSYIDNNSFIQIKKDVLSYIDTHYDKFYTPWFCDTKASYQLEKEFEFKSIAFNNEIKKATEEYFKVWNFEPVSMAIESCWVNVAKKGNFQEIHSHIGFGQTNLFSGVMYIEVDKNSGSFYLENPLPSVTDHMLNSDIFSSQKEITPQNNLLISFPSWMRHRVGKNQSDINRISVSWNIMVEHNQI